MRKKVLISVSIASGLILIAAVIIFATVGSSYTSDGLLHLAGWFDRRGNFSAAESFYRMSLNFNENNIESITGLSRLYESSGNVSASEALLLQNIEAFPSNQSLYLELSAVYVRAGKLEKAVELIDNAPDGYVGRGLSAKRPNVSASPSSGSYGKSIQVELAAEEGVTYYYTLDGSTPDSSSSVYSEPIKLDSGDYELCVVGVSADGIPSRVTSYKYIVNDYTNVWNDDTWVLCPYCNMWISLDK